MEIGKEVSDKILEAALLLEANENLSAAASALRVRSLNRHAAKIILLDLLGINEDDLERIYWEGQSQKL